ncbi:peptidase inhibitor family I36 protein [Bacillus cereus]|uniref:peptidase inhibitor family I36 protein n=1 Tax=Bacillus cereus TaxID=1396 RepID=UPI000BFCFE42|nr:peptidase inhibitor family I36 protein [Bacillus cereus]PGQ05199.1 hypothetical protein COA09_27265 [Bacillus cereus]PGS45349.1 hypothetical protein COC67_30810 [Bacillus cereus]PGU95006.1 hypothetical protein COD77_27165 [Bacillus cereus]
MKVNININELNVANITPPPTTNALEKVRKSVDSLFTDETKSSLKLTITDYNVDQVANLVECISDEAFPREKTILLDQVRLAKRLSYDRNLLSNGDFESQNRPGVNGWRKSAHVKILAENLIFKGRYLHMPSAQSFEQGNVYPSYAYQKIDESKLKPYTRYLVRGFVGNAKDLELLVQRYGNELHIEMDVPDDIRYDMPTTTCGGWERCGQQPYQIPLTHTCTCKDKPQINKTGQHINKSCGCKDPHVFSYHIDTGGLDYTENLGLWFVLKIMSTCGEANVDNLEIIEMVPLTGTALTHMKKREYKWNIEMTQKRFQSDEAIQVAQDAVRKLFTSSQENQLNPDSKFLNLVIAANLVDKIPYVYDSFLIGALPSMNFEIVKQLSQSIDRARGLYTQRNFVRNGTFSFYTNDWHVTEGVEVRTMHNINMLVLSNWSQEASQQLRVAPNHGYVLRVTARKDVVGRGTVKIKDGAENIEILTFTSCDDETIDGENAFWGFVTKTLEFFPDTSQVQIEIGETEGMFEVASVELICMEQMEDLLYNILYQDDIPFNSAACAPINTFNEHSSLFDRLSTDGKPYWDYITKYAPVIYQDVNPTYNVLADCITKFNVDGNWNMADQWETIGVYPQVPYVYASVQETKTHLFLGYYFYHVRDDGPTTFDKHENDLEGMMMAVRKDGNYGVPVAMETVSHSDFLRYRLKDPNVQNGYAQIESTSVRFLEVTHPEIFISSNGDIFSDHGHSVSAFTGNEDVGNDGIVYKFGEPSSGQPNQFSPKWQHTYNYGILPIEELWDRKFNYNDTPFKSFGVFPNTLSPAYGNANAPWNWSDKEQDGTLGLGVFFTDPAYLFDIDFNGLGVFSHEYVYNPYWTHKVILKSVTPKVYKDPSNNLPDIYLSMDRYPLSSKRYISEKVWMKADATLNVPHTVIFGGDQKTANTTFSEPTHTLHIAVSNENPRLWLEVKDYDASDADDYMGSIVIPLDTGNIAGKADLSEAIIDYEVIINQTTPIGQQGVYIYKDSNFSGPYQILNDSVTNFKAIGMNDTVSSIKIIGPYDVVGYSDADFKGRSATLVTTDNLALTNIGNDQMSSIRITRK